MRLRLMVTVLIIALFALFWYVGFYRRSEQSPPISQTPAPPPSTNAPQRPVAALAAPATAPSPQRACPRDRTDNGMLRLSVRSISTAKQIGFWTLAPDHRFVIVEVVLEAITDFQLASSAVLWLEEPDGTERTRSVATGALPRPLPSLSPSRGEGVSGQIAFEVSAQARELTLHYDPFLAGQLTLCVSVP
jgi:hypothetical protein